MLFNFIEIRDIIVAGQYTIADIALYDCTYVANEGGFDLAHYPNINQWLKRVESQPNYVTIAQS
jgi:glutathione S-transferase